MVRTLLAAIIFAFGLALIARADGIFQNKVGDPTAGGGIVNFTSGGGPPPSCSNKLDFSVACNSQYIGIM